MNTSLIKFFGTALVEKNKVAFNTVNNFAMQRGYIVHPDVCNESVMSFLEEITLNPNATFYKTWMEITSKTRLELLFDQLLHYATTYGTNFALGNGYVPNDSDYSDVPEFKKFKVILPITVDELATKCLDVLQSGIALKEETMKVLADFVCDNMEKDSIDADSISNREALVYICDKIGIYPKNPMNLFRYIIYYTTGQTMIVNNRNMFNMIALSSNPFDLTSLDDETLVGLSSIFLRYKELFCAFKHCNERPESANTVASNVSKSICEKLKAEMKTNSSVVNKLRKLAVKHHKPMKVGFWQNVFTEMHSVDELRKNAASLTNYKKVALMQTCLERSNPLENQFYLVRNQKTWIREGYKPSTDASYLMTVYMVLHESLVESMKKNSVVVTTDSEGNEVSTPVTVKVVSGVMVPLPTSEKSFIGNYPFGTSYKLSNHNYLGCYWRNEWGTHDYDLSLLDYNGSKIGWNSSYYNDDKSVVFSGDMTYADPEATEILYMKDGCPKGVIAVSQFSGNPKSKFRLFFGQQDISNFRKNYMVDPNSIKLNVEIEHENQREVVCGVVNEESIVLMAVNCGGGRVSYGNKYSTMMIDSIMHKSKCFVDSVDILKEAGFNVVDETYTGSVDVDFADLNKDSLIALMK